MCYNERGNLEIFPLKGLTIPIRSLIVWVTYKFFKTLQYPKIYYIKHKTESNFVKCVAFILIHFQLASSSLLPVGKGRNLRHQ